MHDAEGVKPPRSKRCAPAIGDCPAAFRNKSRDAAIALVSNFSAEAELHQGGNDHHGNLSMSSARDVNYFAAAAARLRHIAGTAVTPIKRGGFYTSR
jgi:hypothetical protein